MRCKKNLRRAFDMKPTTESILNALEKNAVPLAALDWVFTNVKTEATRRVTIKTKLPFQRF